MTEPAHPLTDETRNRAGRPKGAKNKLPQKLKEAVLLAAERAGGKAGLVGYLKQQAEEEPSAFLTLLGKILPAELKMDGQVTGELVHKITRTVVDPKPRPRHPDA
jgi:hypothetical protein